MRPSLSLLCFFLACGVLIGARTTNAQQLKLTREYDLKAGYFAYFGQYVTWPNKPFVGSDKEFVIGVLGSNPFGKQLTPRGKAFALKSSLFPKPVGAIQRKRIKVVVYKTVGDFQKNYRPCHILFISRSSAPGVPTERMQARVNAALQKTKGQPVLLVGEVIKMAESKRLAKSGVTICYWNDFQADRLKMHINQTAGKRERLLISSRLLGLRLVTVL